jgi:hypothetical protein
MKFQIRDEDSNHLIHDDLTIKQVGDLLDDVDLKWLRRKMKTTDRLELLSGLVVVKITEPTIITDKWEVAANAHAAYDHNKLFPKV